MKGVGVIMQPDNNQCIKRKQHGISKSMMRAIVGAMEVIILTVVYYVGWRHGYSGPLFPGYLGWGKYVLMGVYGLLVWVLFYNTEGFLFGNLKKMELSLAQWIGLFFVNFLTYFQLCLIANGMIPVWPMLLMTVVEFVCSLVWVFLCTAIFHRLYRPHNMIMVFGSNNAVGMKLKMDTRQDKYQVNKLISVDEGMDRIYEALLQFDDVLLNDVPAEIRNDIVKFCYAHEIRVYAVPKISDVIIRGAKDIQLFDTPLILIKSQGLSNAQRFVKRGMDLILALLGLILALPFMLIIALAIKIEDGGPVFYKQKRVTQDYREFNILKFRSMIVDAEKAGQSIPAVGKDPRITKVGRIIRAIRMDELPQIFNILKGDMSVVGPRPERSEHVEKYSEEVPEFGYRLKVKGGLTGYAQIYGKYNTSAYDKLRLDLIYIENYSIWLDIKLILLTLRILFQKESTEGFDAVDKQARLKEEMLKEIMSEDGEQK